MNLASASCLGLVLTVVPGLATAQQATPAADPIVPQTSEQASRLRDALAYREARVEEQSAYVKRLRARLAGLARQAETPKREHQRSVVALRIIRIGSQVEMDRVRASELRVRLHAAENGKPPDTLRDPDPLAAHRRELEAAHRSIARLVAELEGAVTEDRARRHLEKLKAFAGKDLADSAARKERGRP